jgi:hypothetical protein
VRGIEGAFTDVILAVAQGYFVILGTGGKGYTKKIGEIKMNRRQ